jgi:hypothetical protein
MYAYKFSKRQKWNTAVCMYLEMCCVGTKFHEIQSVQKLKWTQPIQTAWGSHKSITFHL